MVRLTFVGDIALDKPLLNAAKARGRGQYDFSDVFHTDEVFAESNLVIGNLETCFGGGNGFNTKPYHYNSPDSFCDAIKAAGIDLVSTANNHCMDEGVSGLQRTLQQLDRCGILHTGTFETETEDRFLLKEIQGIKIAIYSMTYSVNNCIESIECRNLYRYINLTGFSGRSGAKATLIWRYAIRPKLSQMVNKLRKRSTISAHTDSFRVGQINPRWMQDIEKQISQAREKSDILVVLLHSGGQFNTEPGEFSKYMMDKLCALGADIVIGNHSHTVQRIENREGRIVAFSLGGFCMSTSGEYLVKECLPEYSLALHVDIDDGKIKNSKVCLLKGVENEDGYLRIGKADNQELGAGIIWERCGLE